MTTLQIILLCLAIPATLYELIQIGKVNALLSLGRGVRILPGWYFGMLVAVAIQVAFVLALTGRISAPS